MSYLPASVKDRQGNVIASRDLCVKHSATAGANPDLAQMAAGELALNTADGRLTYKQSSGTLAHLPTAEGFNRIVTLTQSAYDAITATVSSTTLYIVTPDPE
jgi:hypothetical protein